MKVEVVEAVNEMEENSLENELKRISETLLKQAPVPEPAENHRSDLETMRKIKKPRNKLASTEIWSKISTFLNNLFGFLGLLGIFKVFFGFSLKFSN